MVPPSMKIMSMTLARPLRAEGSVPGLEIPGNPRTRMSVKGGRESMQFQAIYRQPLQAI